MLTASAEFNALIASRTRGPFRLRFKVAWDGTNYVEESARLLDLSYSRNLSKFTDDMLPASSNDTCVVKLANHDYRFSPFHSGGNTAIRTYLTGPKGTYGFPMSLEYGLLISGVYQYVPLFTGYVSNITPSEADSTAIVYCDDNGQPLVQRKADSWTQRDMTFTEAIKYVYGLGGIVRAWDADDVPLRIPFVYTDDEGIITQCQAIAAACGGFFYHNAAGNPCLKLLYQSLANQTYFELPTTFLALEPVESTSKLATDIIVGYQTRTVGIPDVVYETDTYYTVMPGETKRIELRMDNPLYYAFELDETDYVIDNYAGTDMRASVDVSVTVYGQKIELLLVNRHTTLAARLVYLRLRGVPLEGGPDEQVERNIATITGLRPKERVRSVRDEFYVQTWSTANFLAENLAEIYGTVPRYYNLRSFQINPLLDLLDPVSFYDTRQVSARRKGYVVQINGRWTYPNELSETDVFTQDIVVADAPAALQNNDIFLVGVSAIDGSDVTWH